MEKCLSSSSRCFAICLALLFLPACNLRSMLPGNPNPNPPINTIAASGAINPLPLVPDSPRLPEQTPTPTLPAAATASPTVSLTNPPAATVTPAEMTVKIFLIATGDNGHAGPLVGCGDSAVGVIVHVPYSTGVLRAALTALLANHSQHYGESGLYNALYQSHLAVDDVAIASGVATIRLTGTLTMGGECDSPRVEAQLKQTAMQFSTVHSVSIFINGRPLANVLSGR
jgi:hypothetical protein